jgi:sec-independent protein translocase protein TatB
MFDIGWSEMLVIAIVVVIFIGPKELPGVLREVGRWVRKVQGMASEFRGHVDDMVRDSDLAELRQQVEQLKNANLEAELRKAVDPNDQIQQAFQVPDLTDPTPSILPPQNADPTAGSSPAPLSPPVDLPGAPPADQPAASKISGP